MQANKNRASNPSNNKLFFKTEEYDKVDKKNPILNEEVAKYQDSVRFEIKPENIINGIIFAEIISKPRAMRRGRL